MNWNQFIARFPKGSKIFLEIGKHRAIDMKMTDDGIYIVQSTKDKPLSRKALLVLDDFSGNVSNSLELLLTSRVLADGPRIFSPGQLELELMGQMDINVTIKDYVQPFETVVIELPDNYVKNMIVECPQGGEVHEGQLMPLLHQPALCVLYHRPDLGCISAMIVLDSMQSIKSDLIPREDELIEHYISDISGRSYRPYQGSQETSLAELKMTEQVYRACMNYCLLLDEIGVRCLGPQNASYANRLERYAQIARKTGNKSRLAEVEDEIRVHPVRYELKQKVKLYRSVRSEAELPQADGPHKSPHIRRGHYRMQAVGVGRTERKRVRIPPIFVNRRFFLGDDSDTEVRYT